MSEELKLLKGLLKDARSANAEKAKEEIKKLKKELAELKAKSVADVACQKRRVNALMARNKTLKHYESEFKDIDKIKANLKTVCQKADRSLRSIEKLKNKSLKSLVYDKASYYMIDKERVAVRKIRVEAGMTRTKHAKKASHKKKANHAIS